MRLGALLTLWQQRLVAESEVNAMRQRKNLLLIITDQQRADTIARAGNAYIQTPNLDRLCETGTLYSNAYSEMPECCPARAVMFSGQWGHRTGNMGNGFANPLSSTFVHALNDEGYQTTCIGKMHAIPRDNTWGFQDVYRSEEMGHPDLDDYNRYVRDLGFDWVYETMGVRHEYYYIPQVSQLPDRLHQTTWVGDQTVDAINRLSVKDKPWFITASFVKPHPPFDPTTPYLNLYDPEVLPPPVRNERDRDEIWPLQQAQNYAKWMEQPGDTLTRLIKAAYYASISQIDVQIGRIVDELERHGLREETVILFTSDHGEMLGDHYQWGKRSFYDGSARIPFIISCPGSLPQGAVSDQLVGHRDIAPTLLDAANLLDERNVLDGHSLLRSSHDTPREITFGELVTNPYGVIPREEAVNISSIYMAATKKWKYIYSPNGGREALFNLEIDPNELVPLENDDSHAETKQTLRTALLEFFQREDYKGGLSEDGQQLRQVPLSEVPTPRNRQYSSYDPYHLEARKGRR